MPSVGTGAMLANKKLIAIGVSGDGDTGAIGIGQFVHLMRRNLPIIYIIEDNGCYGLTKGQFSPTADLGSKLKTGVVNDLPPIDTCALAIELGATFVARSFSGDKKQLLSLLKAALAHRGTVMLDVISPCVTFNDHEGSTKSYAYVKDHDDPVEEVSFVPFFEDITVDYEPGTTQEVTMHDGSKLFLKKLEEDYDPTDKIGALKRLHETARRGEFATGLIYIEPDRDDFLHAAERRRRAAGHPAARRVRPGRKRSKRSWKGCGRSQIAMLNRQSIWRCDCGGFTRRLACRVKIADESYDSRSSLVALVATNSIDGNRRQTASSAFSAQLMRRLRHDSRAIARDRVASSHSLQCRSDCCPRSRRSRPRRSRPDRSAVRSRRAPAPFGLPICSSSGRSPSTAPLCASGSSCCLVAIVGHDASSDAWRRPHRSG